MQIVEKRKVMIHGMDISSMDEVVRLGGEILR